MPSTAQRWTSSAFIEEIERSGRPVRCEVTLSDAAGARIAVARHVDADGLRVHLQPEDAASFSPGRVIELDWARTPVGPMHAAARVASIGADRDEHGQPVLAASLDFVDLDEEQRSALKERLRSLPIAIVTAGLERPLDAPVPSVLRVIDAGNPEDLPRCLERENAAVLVLGPRLNPARTHALLTRVFAEFPDSPTVNIVIGAGPQPEAFQEFVDEDRIFYLSRAGIADEQLRSILAAGVRHFQSKLERLSDAEAREDMASDRVLDFCIRLSAQQDLPNASGLLVESTRTFLTASHARCLVYDSAQDTLTSHAGVNQEAQADSAASGLVGFVARTGEAIRLDRIEDDARYDAEADNPEGLQDARFLAAPIFGAGAAIAGVVTAARDGRSAPFTAADARLLAVLAGCAAPTLAVIFWQARVQDQLHRRAHRQGSRDIFRQEAIDHNTRSWDEEGTPMMGPPAWLRRTHWITVLLLLTGFAYMIMARIDENAAGPVIVRARNKIAVTATTAGLVRSVEVSTGDRVRGGDLLVRLHESTGASTVERLREQLRAPGDGVVSDIRVRPGQQLNPGDQVASIVDEQAGYELIALMPGSYAPQIQPGMQCLVKLAGYPEAHEVTAIGRVSSEIVGPHEAARYAGGGSADALAVAGPVVIVHSVLLPAKFRSGPREYWYHDGMTGDAEVTVRSEPMVFSLVPGLKELWRR